MHAVSAALNWFRDADEKALAEDGPRRWSDIKRGQILGGLAPALLPASGNPRATYKVYEDRYAAYKEKGAAAKVASWINEAKTELKQGKPAFALVLGRELHWIDADEYRSTSLELLCASYEALGPQALAAIAKVHHTNRDLKTVGVYEHA